MFLKLACWLWLVVACASAGCLDSNAGQPSAAPYHTVRIEPLRDTEAAKQGNQEGLKHLAENDLTAAAQAFQRALAADVEFGPAHNNLGKVYYRQKKWHEAAWEFEYACKLLPKYAEPRNNLGMVLDATGDLTGAIDQYREAISLADNVQYNGNLASALIRRGDRTEEVRQLLQQLAAKDPRPEWQNWARRQLATFTDKP